MYETFEETAEAMALQRCTDRTLDSRFLTNGASSVALRPARGDCRRGGHRLNRRSSPARTRGAATEAVPSFETGIPEWLSRSC